MAFDPSARPTTEAVREHVGQVISMLATRYRVEYIWDAVGNVRPPNGALMVGIPGSNFREHEYLTLPTWMSPAQIAGAVAAQLEDKRSAQTKWRARLWIWIMGVWSKNPNVVPEPI